MVHWYTAGATEKLHVTSGGDINIGTGDETTSADNLLEMYVGSSDEAYATIRGKYNRSNEYNRSEVRFGVEDNSVGEGFLAFATGTNSATERMRIDSSGRNRILYTTAGGTSMDTTDAGMTVQLIPQILVLVVITHDVLLLQIHQ